MKKTSLIPKTNIYISHGTNDNLIDYETSKESLNFYIENYSYIKYYDIKFLLFFIIIKGNLYDTKL